MTASDKLARLTKLLSQIRTSEAYLVDATGGDRRAELRHVNKLRKEYHALRHEDIDGIPSTTGEAALLTGMTA